jgi:hypothetical protein
VVVTINHEEREHVSESELMAAKRFECAGVREEHVPAPWLVLQREEAFLSDSLVESWEMERSWRRQVKLSFAVLL